MSDYLQTKAELRKSFEEDFLLFCRFVFSEQSGGGIFEEENHHRITASALTDCWNGKKSKLIISMPPGFGKTTLAIYYIAWSFLKQPAANYIYISYSETRCITSSIKIRDILSLSAVINIWGQRIKNAENSKTWYVYDRIGGALTRVGMFRLSACDGQITGFDAGTIGGDARHGGVVIDDFLKATDAYSPAKRKKGWNTFTNTILTRLRSPKASVIVIMQRLHALDLVGCILAQQKNLSDKDPEKYRLIKIQAWNKKTKKASWEKILPRAKIETLLKENVALFESQYQQEPENITNNFFEVKRLKIELYYKLSPEKPLESTMQHIVRGWDFNYNSSEKSDWTVGVKLGYKDGEYYILDVLRIRAKAGDPQYDLKTFVLQIARNDYQSEVGPRVIQSFPEDPGYNLALEFASSLHQMGIPVRRSREFTPKSVRWYPLSVAIRAGHVTYVKKSDNQDDEFARHEFEYELKCGTGGEHDDQTDALSRAFNDIQILTKVQYNTEADFVAPFIGQVYE